MEKQTQAKTQTSKQFNITGTGGEEIRDLMDRFANAFKNRNIEEIMSFYANDVVAYDIAPPLQFKGKDAYRKSWQQFADMAEAGFQYVPEDVNIIASGDLGASYCLSHMTGKTKDGENVDAWMRHTGVYKKLNGQWKIIHENLSVPIDMKTDKALWNLDPHKPVTH